MKRKMLIIMMVSIVAGMAFSQGALNPSGVPGATMKTLTELNSSITAISNDITQVESRIDLSTVAGDFAYAHVITESGSYYLSSNLNLTDKSAGINVQVADVTIDLNGFEITRSTEGGYGIAIEGGGVRTYVKNGSIRNFEYGIHSLGSQLRLEDITLSECSESGIYAQNVSTIINCQAYNNSGNGINAYEKSSIIGCIASKNQGEFGIKGNNGSIISKCVATDNAGDGFYTGNGSTISQCIARNNGTSGIFANESCLIRECISKDNSNGYLLNGDCTVNNCSAIDNLAEGFLGTGTNYQLTACIAKENAAGGIVLGDNAILENCIATGNNGGYGIDVGKNSIIKKCSSTANVFNQYLSSGINVGEGSIVQDSISMANESTYATEVASQGSGIKTGEGVTVKDCLSAQNKGHGILLNYNCTAAGNLCDNNGLYSSTGAGINVFHNGSRVENNQLTGNDYGIATYYTNNVIVKNIASGNSTEEYFFLYPQQVFKGSTITNLTTINTLDSWANFEF